MSGHPVRAYGLPVVPGWLSWRALQRLEYV